MILLAVACGLAFDQLFSHIVDSSDTLDDQNLQVLAEPPPTVSFRTKKSKSSPQPVPKLPYLMDEDISPINHNFGLTEYSIEEVQSPSDEGSSMSEFYTLRIELLLSTLVWTGVLFGSTYFFYDLNIALNYLLGAFAGLAYLGLLSRNVERLGTSKQVGKSQLAVFVGVIFLTTQIDTLHVLPVFLGFCTYKLAVLVYTLRSAVFNS